MFKYLLCSFTLIICLMLGSAISEAEAKENTSEGISNDLHHYLLDYDVVIDIGHGGVDSGTLHGDLLEKHLNLEIGAKLYYILKEKGYRVGITRLHDYALSDDSTLKQRMSRHKRDLNQRRLIAEGTKPKLFICIHVNFSSHRSIKGPLILYQNQAESYLFADLLQLELNELARTSKPSLLGRNYYLLKNISPPSLIAEVGYISHSGEREKLQDPMYQQQIAEQISKAVDQFLILYP